MRKRRAFSLTELLIVIAILIVLIAIMLPSLARARAAGQRAACLGNTHGITHTVHMYVQDWDSFMTLDQKGPNETGNWMADLGPYGNSEKARQCPTASGYANRPGNASTAWYWPDPMRVVTGAYAFNGWLYNPVRLEKPEPGKRPGNDLDVDNADPKNFFKKPVVKNTAAIPVFSDAIWMEAFPLPTDFIADLYVGSYTSCDDQMGRVAIDRHRKKVDVSFYDGHSESIDIPKLWTLQWNAQWQTPVTLPGLPSQ